MSGPAPVLRGLAVALAVTAPAVSGMQAQGGSAPTWTQVVDVYLEGRSAEAATALLSRQPDEVTAAAREAFDAWRREARATSPADARRVHRRRLQASAMLPLEILLAIRMPAQPSPRLAALELISRDAVEQLDALQRRASDSSTLVSSGRLSSFRTWWRLGLLQFLTATGRYEDFRRQSDAFGAPPDDEEAAAEHHFLRGLAAETQARLPEEVSVGSGSRAEAPKPRVPFIADTLGEARREYARALALQPAHAESLLRLARVDVEAGRASAAQGALATLTTDPCATPTCGLAWLFLGQAAEATGDHAAAASAFLKAAQVPLVSRAARISQLSHGVRSGGGEDLMRLADTFEDRAAHQTRTPRPDGWAMYLSGQRTDGHLMIRRLRALLEP